MNVTLYDKIKFAGVIKLKILRWEDYSQLSYYLSGLNVITGILIKGMQGKSESERKQLMTEVSRACSDVATHINEY